MHNLINRKRMFSRRGIKDIQVLIEYVVQSSRIGTSGPYICTQLVHFAITILFDCGRGDMF